MLKPYSENCTCIPGTESNGWHEVRCGDCRAAESAIWARMMHRQRSASNYARTTNNGLSYIDNYMEFVRNN